jgi:hypothetical protein
MVVAMQSHVGCLRGASLSMLWSFERALIDAEATVRRPPDQVSTRKMLKTMLQCFELRYEWPGVVGWVVRLVLCLGVDEGTFVVDFASLRAVRRRS